jgi:hypothetical protein
VKTVRKLKEKLESDQKYKELFGHEKLTMQTHARLTGLSLSVAIPLSKLKNKLN